MVKRVIPPLLAALSLFAVLSQGGVSASACRTGYIQIGKECVAVALATDTEVREHLISESLASYSGSCPCPYNMDSLGRRCGGRSAYSRPGGESPQCYPKDITDKDVRTFRDTVR